MHEATNDRIINRKKMNNPVQLCPIKKAPKTTDKYYDGDGFPESDPFIC